MQVEPTSARIRRVALFYCLAATVWIFASDSILLATTPLPADLTSYQSVKGLFFIAATTVGLVFVLHGERKLRDQLVCRLRRQSSRIRNQDHALPELTLDAKHRESLLHLLLGHAPAAFAMFDRDMKYIYASQRWVEDHELESNPIGRYHYEVFPDIPERWKEMHRRALTGEVREAQEDCFTRASGEEFWSRWTIRPWHQTDGAIGGIVIFSEDITESKQFAERLALAGSVFEHANEAITVTDPQGTIVMVNQAFTTITGYEREEAIGQNPRILKSGKHDAEFYGRLYDSLNTTGSWYGEITNRRKDGTNYPEFLTISAVKNDANEVLYYVAHFYDLSRERGVEEVLHTTEMSLANITNSMQDIVYTLDCEMRVTGVFGPWLESFGLMPDFVLGKTAVDILGPSDGKIHSDAIARALMGEPTVYEWSILTEELTRHFQISLSPVLDSEGEVTGLVGVGRDVTELVDARLRAAKQVERLSSLRAVDTAIAGTFDLNLVLRVVIDQVIDQLDICACSVLLLDPHTQSLTYAAGRGFTTRFIERTRLRLGEGIAGQALLEGRRLRQMDPLNSEHFKRSKLLAQEPFADYYAVPMVAKGHLIGVLEVFRSEATEETEDWLMFLDTLAGLAGIAVDSAQLFRDVQRSHLDVVLAYDATIEGWSKALDLRDKETEGHTQRVTELTDQLARRAGIPDADLAHIRRGALLHDIGKMGIRDCILLKEGPLTDEEWVEMRKHPELAYQMLSPIEFLRPSLDIPYCHHEKWDGTGYPRGLKGEQIPYAARLFAVVDVWDALRSDRPYRAAWPRERVLKHIQGLSGTHFDPRAVELFMDLMEDADGVEYRAGYLAA